YIAHQGIRYPGFHSFLSIRILRNVEIRQTRTVQERSSGSKGDRRSMFFSISCRGVVWLLCYNSLCADISDQLQPGGYDRTTDPDFLYQQPDHVHTPYRADF